MTLPFGVWEAGDSLLQAVEYEVEEDEEELLESSSISYKIEFHDSNTKNVKCDLLVFSIGIAACSFMENYFEIPSQEIVRITEENNTSSRGRTKHSPVYSSGDVTYVCCRHIPEPAHCKLWIRTVFQSFHAKQVVVLSSTSKTKMFDHLLQDNGEDVLRCVKTSHCTCAVASDLLEEGLLITGLPAAIISHCEQATLSCVTYINYMESHFVDVFTLKTFAKALDDVIFEKVSKVDNKTLVRNLKHFEGISGADRSVYI